MVGWYTIEEDAKMSCFYGIKTDMPNTKVKVDYSPRIERTKKPDIARGQTVLAR